MTIENTQEQNQLRSYQIEGIRDLAYRAWQGKLAQELPNLAARTFALRERSYLGCGFHYELERRLGHVISIANDFNGKATIAATRREIVAARLANKAVIDAFKVSLQNAEASAGELDPTRKNAPLQVICETGVDPFEEAVRDSALVQVGTYLVHRDLEDQIKTLAAGGSEILAAMTNTWVGYYIPADSPCGRDCQEVFDAYATLATGGEGKEAAASLLQDKLATEKLILVDQPVTGVDDQIARGVVRLAEIYMFG